MASEGYDIRNPAPELGDAGETLKQAHSLALMLTHSDQCEDAASDVAGLILDLLERAHQEFVEQLDTTGQAVEKVCLEGRGQA